jgi:hypothetical protein
MKYKIQDTVAERLMILLNLDKTRRSITYRKGRSPDLQTDSI